MPVELPLGYFFYLGLCVEAFLFGLYSGIFAMYLQHYGSLQQSTDKARNILFYALWMLYALSAAIMIVDTNILEFWWPDAANIETEYHLTILQVTIFACCDFIAQSILIYRCWIVWGYNIHVVIVPSLLAFTFLALWIASGTAPLSIIQGQFYDLAWSNILAQTGLTLSITVNALVTGLIVFRIFKVFKEVKTSTLDDQILGVTGGSLQRVIFILIESGMALFSIQLARLVVGIVTTDAALDTFYLIVGIHEMINGITPTIILVRVSMGLSFHDESSMVKATSSIGSLRFAPEDPNPVPENGIVDERRHDDIEIQLSDDSDIQMVDR